MGNTKAISQSPQSSTPELTLLWESDTLLTTVESVIYDPDSRYIYTSNIIGHFLAQDGEGTLSKLNLDGDIIDVDWIEGLNAPTGLTIRDGALYTTDINRVIEVDIAEGQISRIHSIEQAEALNDVTVTTSGTVYTTDTGGNAIYQIKENQVTTFLHNIDTPNGLLHYDDHLLVTQWTPGTLGQISIASAAVTPIASGIPQTDGVEILGDIGYLVASWGGKVYYVPHGGDAVLLLDTSAEGIQAADVTFVPEQDLVLVATFDHNSVMAYQIKY